jgi:prevent-host-death family protein
MRTIEIDQATASLAEYAKGMDKDPIILTVGGKPVAALIPIENADLETITLSTNPQFLGIIERSRARQKAEGGISSEEMRRRLGLSGEGSAGQLLLQESTRKTGGVTHESRRGTGENSYRAAR